MSKRSRRVCPSDLIHPDTKLIPNQGVYNVRVPHERICWSLLWSASGVSSFSLGLFFFYDALHGCAGR